MNIAYARVSTASQTLEPQLRELRNYAALRGITIDEEITDVISGSKSSRAGLDRLMSLVRSGKVKIVLVSKLDRIARSMSHFAAVVAELNKLKVALIVPGQNIDTSESNPASRFLISILGSVAELERDLIRERTIAGLAVARANGKTLGRKSKTLVRGGTQADIINRWRTNKARTYRKLAQELHCSIGTAWRIERATPQVMEVEV